MANSSSTSWWKSGVVYQIYPASFQDTNNDGIGDLRGIIQHLDYVKSLGATIIWLSPMYDSPQHDMGYDIRDYRKIYPPYGDMADMDELIEKAHAKGLKLILDLVINHTSDEHEWFKDSRSSKFSSKRDWYIWKPAKYDEQGNRCPPNNWASFFGGSAWQWDEATEEYYLHLFVKQQPDFNFENETARKALYEDSINFWLDKDIDGFRIDTCVLYSKDQSFPDAPITDPKSDIQYPTSIVGHGPRIHEFLHEIGQILAGYNAMSVGECGDAPTDTILKYISAGEQELNMVFLFDVIEVGMGKPYRYRTEPRTWNLPDINAAIERQQRLIVGTDAWTTVFLENHDIARSVSRWGDDSTPESWARSAKMLALLQGCLSGTLYIYQGQEIGMVNIPLDWPLEEYIDVDSQAYIEIVKKQCGSDEAKLAQELIKAKRALQHLARDNARTPMQWEAKRNGGFTSDASTPWMRVNDSAQTINAASQIDDPSSVLAFWKRVLSLRAQHPELFVHGEYECVDKSNESVMAFTKTAGNAKAFLVANFTGQDQPIPESGLLAGGKLLLSNVDEQKDFLQPWEARAVLVDRRDQ